MNRVSEVSPPAVTRFVGLDSLRFWAAFLVFLGHVPLNQASAGLPNPNWGALFYRGAPAVSFFFTLSGFLITYLLLAERRQTSNIDVGAFYTRRILRIWPLYFLIVTAGLIFYNSLLPWLGITYQVRYRLGTAILLYTFLLPHLMNSLYTVGGILNPLWSIGVEEQFYLSWAPVVRRWGHRLPGICVGIMALSAANFVVSEWNVFHLGALQKFALQLKFHFCASGALAAWALSERREALLSLASFRIPWLQALLYGCLLQYLLIDLVPLGELGAEGLQLLLYTWLVIEVAANPARLLRIQTRPTEWLGKISYGFYMFHMIAVYGTTGLFKYSAWWSTFPVALYVFSYYSCAFVSTVALAALSYQLFERRALQLKCRFMTYKVAELAR